SQQIQTVIVDDITAPVPDVATLSDVTGECEVTSLTSPTATDNCSGIVIATHDVILPITSSITVNWTYTDDAGNSTIQAQNVVIEDITAPVADIADLEDIVENCSVVIANFPTATDNCNGTITATTTNPLEYYEVGSYIITWTYFDDSGNSSSQDQFVTVVNAPPVVETVDITVYINEEGIATITPEDIDNNSSDDCEIVSITLDITEFTTSDVGENVVTLTVVDNADNSVSKTAIVTVVDENIYEFKIPNYVSPNNDGVNDLWLIEGVELLEGFALTIFNNIGEIVYTSDNYDNTWDATFNNKELPNGTYFYIFSDGETVHKGFISVGR
ncbi:MAG: gliding motility-associated C-terminal domain-containing protein, partial [Bacteroidales bacterium]|nr:gliding motility-associated C-terminal domain-containing protein [Bacteroidales bacterium]